MITAFIITLTVAIIFIALYLDERGTVKEYRDEVKSKIAEILRLQGQSTETREAADSAAPAETTLSVALKPEDGHDLLNLTPDLVADAVRYNGYVPEKEDDGVFFMAQGERYFIPTDRLPYVLVMKRYGLDKDGFDMELMRNAAAKASDDRFIGKVSISDDASFLSFHVASIEPKYGHFRDVLSEYVSIINDLENLFRVTCDQMEKDREDMAKLEANGIPVESAGKREGKIVS